MPDYRKMYFDMAAVVADAMEILQKALEKGEESYCKESEAKIIEVE